jgi:hypothetical protein
MALNRKHIDKIERSKDKKCINEMVQLNKNWMTFRRSTRPCRRRPQRSSTPSSGGPEGQSRGMR